jgi:hypothetical protein
LTPLSISPGIFLKENEDLGKGDYKTGYETYEMASETDYITENVNDNLEN